MLWAAAGIRWAPRLRAEERPMTPSRRCTRRCTGHCDSTQTTPQPHVLAPPPQPCDPPGYGGLQTVLHTPPQALQSLLQSPLHPVRQQSLQLAQLVRQFPDAGTTAAVSADMTSAPHLAPIAGLLLAVGKIVAGAVGMVVIVGAVVVTATVVRTINVDSTVVDS
eukprot:gene10962-biopygen8998